MLIHPKQIFFIGAFLMTNYCALNAMDKIEALPKRSAIVSTTRALQIERALNSRGDIHANDSELITSAGLCFLSKNQIAQHKALKRGNGALQAEDSCTADSHNRITVVRQDSGGAASKRLTSLAIALVILGGAATMYSITTDELNENSTSYYKRSVLAKFSGLLMVIMGTMVMQLSLTNIKLPAQSMTTTAKLYY